MRECDVRARRRIYRWAVRHSDAPRYALELRPWLRDNVKVRGYFIGPLDVYFQEKTDAMKFILYFG